MMILYHLYKVKSICVIINSGDVMINILLVYIYMIMFSNSLVNITKRSLLKVLPFTVMISAIALFVSQFVFHTFYVGLALLILFCFEFIVSDIFIKKKSLKELKEIYITKDLLVFSIVYLLIIIYDFRRFYTHWDELSHWGKMVKEMYRLDSFYSVNSANLLVHKDYPPIISLYELLISYISLGFNEFNLIRGLHLFEAVLVLFFLPISNGNKKELVYKTIFSVGFIFLLTLLFDTALVVNSIYTDYVLALLVAFIIGFILTIKELKVLDIILVGISMIFILLTKQVSIAFYLMSLFVYIIILFFNKNNRNLKNMLWSLLMVVIIPLIFFLGWRVYIKHLGITGQFDLGLIKLNEILSIARGTGGLEWQKETLMNYLYAVFDKSILNSKLLKLSFIQLMFIIEASLLGCFMFAKDKQNKSNLLILLITFLIGSGGYMLLMLLLYVFAFGSYEGPILASYDRYMSTYILICLYTVCFIYLIKNYINFDNLKKNYIILMVLLFAITPTAYLKIRPEQVLIKNTKFDGYQVAASYIDNYVKLNDKVFIIDQNEHDGAVFNINYFSNKFSTNLEAYTFDLVNNPEEYFYQVYYKYLKDYNYLYTYNIDSDYINKYSFLFKDGVESNTLYKVLIIDEHITLEKIPN